MTAANVKDLTLAEWQELVDAFKVKFPKAKPCVAMRIDGTQLSTARHFGGFRYNGDTYTVFYFADGALLGVRDDFLRWATKKVEAQAKQSNSPTAGRDGKTETAEATAANPTAQGVSR